MRDRTGWARRGQNQILCFQCALHHRNGQYLIRQRAKLAFIVADVPIEQKSRHDKSAGMMKSSGRPKESFFQVIMAQNVVESSIALKS